MFLTLSLGQTRSVTEPNTSILKCPECEKSLVKIGSQVKRIHPVACFVKDHYMKIVLSWVILMPLMLAAVPGRDTFTGSLGVGLGFSSLFFVPFVVNYFLLRAFPLYRITDCPYCDFHEKQRLGFSQSGEY